MQDQNGNHKAVKVVSKQSIRSRKNKTKVSRPSRRHSCRQAPYHADPLQLWAEIKLHQMLSHPHIVGFEDCFEDEENVYMILELCEHGVSGPRTNLACRS